VLAYALYNRLDVAPRKKQYTGHIVIKRYRKVDFLRPGYQPGRYFAETVKVSKFGDWSKIADDATLEKVFAIISREPYRVSFRTMRGTGLKDKQVQHLKDFLHGRGWSTTEREAQVLNDKGREEVANHYPAR
jgi:hypothetical protein